MPNIHERDGVVGWMTHKTQARLAALIDEYEINSIIEVGCFVGLSTIFFAKRVKRVVAIDHFNALSDDKLLIPFLKKREIHLEAALDQFAIFLLNTKKYDNITHVRASSEDAANEMKVMRADMVFIDASHAYEDVKQDIELWTPYARKLICGDDNSPTWPGVQRAANELGAVTDKGRIWWKGIENDESN